jgi:predicted metal-dependent RNase
VLGLALLETNDNSVRILSPVTKSIFTRRPSKTSFIRISGTSATNVIGFSSIIVAQI